MPYRIAPPPLFGQVYYRDNADGEGWSEGWWINDLNYNTGMDKLRQVADTMRSLHTEEIQTVYLRISDTRIRGDVVIADSGLGTGAGSFTVASGQPRGSTPSPATFKIRLKGSADLGAGPRPVFATHGFHSIPKVAIVDGADRVVSTASAWWTYATSLMSTLVSTGWLLGVAKKPGITPPQYVVWNVTDFSFQRYLGNRKTGRPFGLPVGHHAQR